MFGSASFTLLFAVLSIKILLFFPEALVSPVTCECSWFIINHEFPKPMSSLGKAVYCICVLFMDLLSFFGILQSSQQCATMLFGLKVSKTIINLDTKIVDGDVLFSLFVLSTVIVYLLNRGYLRFLKWPKTKPYHYSPLSSKSDIIRLLRLLPGKDKQSSIRCELFEYTLRDVDALSNPYEALSYVWGGEEKPRSITIDDQELSITQNLHTALLRLRNRGIPRVVWVDAVCINQVDENEKEHQISVIPEVYAKASSVIVWLGEAYDNGDQALESIRRASKESVEPLDIRLTRRPILQLLDRPWFNRIWVGKQTLRIVKYIN
jgi:hypothetical protein